MSTGTGSPGRQCSRCPFYKSGGDDERVGRKYPTQTKFTDLGYNEWEFRISVYDAVVSPIENPESVHLTIGDDPGRTRQRVGGKLTSSGK